MGASKRDRVADAIDVTATVLGAMGVPRFSSERSNRMYDEHTKIGLLVLRQHLGVPYRELCLMLPSLRAWRGRVPDHSTLVKFSGRVGQGVLEAVLRATASMLCGSAA